MKETLGLLWEGIVLSAVFLAMVAAWSLLFMCARI